MAFYSAHHQIKSQTTIEAFGAIDTENRSIYMHITGLAKDRSIRVLTRQVVNTG